MGLVSPISTSSTHRLERGMKGSGLKIRFLAFDFHYFHHRTTSLCRKAAPKAIPPQGGKDPTNQFILGIVESIFEKQEFTFFQKIKSIFYVLTATAVYV
jgi:hypothetical protein